jgi:hypothetical protein
MANKYGGSRSESSSEWRGRILVAKQRSKEWMNNGNHEVFNSELKTVISVE